MPAYSAIKKVLPILLLKKKKKKKKKKKEKKTLPDLAEPLHVVLFQTYSTKM